MTGQEVYNLALSFVPELQNEVPDLDDYKIGWVNLAIAEALEAENSIRRFYGEEELLTAPRLKTLSEEIPYHDSITQTALAYGIAEHAFVDDDNDYRSNKARSKFIVALNEAAKYTVTDIEDCY